jgi:hypothetical protein
MQRHVQIATVQNCPDDKIIKITESCQKCKQLAPVENCIFIFNQMLDKLPKICVQTLNYILPPKENLNLPFGHYVSRVFKDHSAGMMYSIDITWEPMGRQTRIQICPTNTHYVNTYIRSNIFSSKKYSKLLCLCWTKIFHKIKNFPQNNHKNIINQSFAVSLFVCILFVQILRKLFLTRDLADCARVLILSRHNNFLEL